MMHNTCCCACRVLIGCVCRSFDQEAAAVLMTRIAVWRTGQPTYSAYPLQTTSSCTHCRGVWVVKAEGGPRTSMAVSVCVVLGVMT